MHISISAAILILSLLFLATSKAGLKVLGVLVVPVGGGGYLALNGYLDDAVRARERHDRLAQQQECAVKATARTTAPHPVGDQGYVPFDPNCQSREGVK